MKTAPVVVLALALSSCSGDDSDNRGCETPTGTWLLKFNERKPLCYVGAFESVAFFDGTRNPRDAVEGCTGVYDLSEDDCKLTMDQTCDLLSPSGDVLGSMQMVGSMRFVNDDRLTGQFQISIDDENGFCSSVFDLTGKPQ